MSDEIKNPENEATTEQSATELSESSLEQVTGGVTDLASPSLYQNCAGGKHIVKGNIT